MPALFARERVFNLSSFKHWGPSTSSAGPCEMFLGSLDGLRDSLVLLPGLCQQGRVCKVASGFSLPAPSPLFWVSPWMGLGSLKELLALPCECWNSGMGSLSRKCLAHRVYSCNVLLPPALTPALPSDSWTFGPRAASAGPVATAFSRLLTVSAFSSVLHSPILPHHLPYLFCFIRKGGAVGYSVVTALSDVFSVYRKRDCQKTWSLRSLSLSLGLVML